MKPPGEFLIDPPSINKEMKLFLQLRLLYDPDTVAYHCQLIFQYNYHCSSSYCYYKHDIDITITFITFSTVIVYTIVIILTIIAVISVAVIIIIKNHHD